MPRLINWELLTPRNIIVIGLMATAWHIVLSPIFASLSGIGAARHPAPANQNTGAAPGWQAAA